MKIFLSFFMNLKDFGIDVLLVIAGVAGGIAFLPKNTTQTRLQKFTSVVSGGFAANYLTPLFGRLLNLHSDTYYGLAFIIGYGGLKSVELGWKQLEIRLNQKNESSS